jgi:RNA polymerase sigma factor (sigma-70 family)
MNTLCIILFINIFNLCASLYLNNYQFKLINNLLRNPLLKNKERDHINIILYKAYENFAIKKAIEFKNLHKYKCSDIKIEELFFASRMGLFKSIKKYNGKYQFINYSTIYINAELYKLLTEKYSLSILPKSYRSKNKSALSMAELIKYKRLLNTKLSCQYEAWQLDTIFVNNQDINEENGKNDCLKETIHKLTPFSKRVLQLKYNLVDNVIISNNKIAKLMGCSEETIRKELVRIKQMANTE